MRPTQRDGGTQLDRPLPAMTCSRSSWGGGSGRRGEAQEAGVPGGGGRARGAGGGESGRGGLATEGKRDRRLGNDAPIGEKFRVSWATDGKFSDAGV